MIKEEILKMLKKKEGYVSGQLICDTLGVSRTAVWKAISSLKEDGYSIEASTNRGYHLVGDADIIELNRLQDKLIDTGILDHVEYKKVVDSTNRQARDYAESRGEYKNKPLSIPSLFIADEQTAGRGRLGRKWISKKGSGIWMSFLIKPDIYVQLAPSITLIAAIAVCESIRNKADVDAGIKWPNDIVADGKKICGILSEMSADTDGIRYIVTGIGINANKVSLPEEISSIATSIEELSGNKVDRTDMIIDISNNFIRLIGKLEEDKGLGSLLKEYEKLSVNIGRMVTVLDPQGEYQAMATGIDDNGALIVNTDEKKEIHIISGEVSVRGIYGHYA